MPGFAFLAAPSPGYHHDIPTVRCMGWRRWRA